MPYLINSKHTVFLTQSVQFILQRSFLNSSWSSLGNPKHVWNANRYFDHLSCFRNFPAFIMRLARSFPVLFITVSYYLPVFLVSCTVKVEEERSREELDTRKLRTERLPAGLVMGRHGLWSSTKPITRYCKSPCIMCLLSKPRAALCFLNTGQELILIISTSNQRMLWAKPCQLQVLVNFKVGHTLDCSSS